MFQRAKIRADADLLEGITERDLPHIAFIPWVTEEGLYDDGHLLRDLEEGPNKHSYVSEVAEEGRPSLVGGALNRKPWKADRVALTSAVDLEYDRARKIEKTIRRLTRGRRIKLALAGGALVGIGIAGIASIGVHQDDTNPEVSTIQTEIGAHSSNVGVQPTSPVSPSPCSISYFSSVEHGALPIGAAGLSADGVAAFLVWAAGGGGAARKKAKERAQRLVDELPSIDV